MKRKPSVAVKRMLAEFEQAAKQVLARGDKPPWSGHPRALDFALYEADELSQRHARLVKSHLRGCATCRRTHRCIAKELRGARTHEEALAIVQRRMAEESQRKH